MMAVNPTKKVNLVSARELPDLVESAVKAANLRLGAQVSGPLVKRWDIAGKVLKNYAAAQSFSKEVTAE